ncbi:hypothetical protein ACRAWF_29660 [Streptomyces sp. L7]
MSNRLKNPSVMNAASSASANVRLGTLGRRLDLADQGARAVDHLAELLQRHAGRLAQAARLVAEVVQRGCARVELTNVDHVTAHLRVVTACRRA